MNKLIKTKPNAERSWLSRAWSGIKTTSRVFMACAPLLSCGGENGVATDGGAKTANSCSTVSFESSHISNSPDCSPTNCAVYSSGDVYIGINLDGSINEIPCPETRIITFKQETIAINETNEDLLLVDRAASKEITFSFNTIDRSDTVAYELEVSCQSESSQVTVLPTIPLGDSDTVTRSVAVIRTGERVYLNEKDNPSAYKQIGPEGNLGLISTLAPKSNGIDFWNEYILAPCVFVE